MGDLELRAQPILYLKLKEGETHKQAVERLTELLYGAGIDINNSSLTVENTEIREN